MADDGEEREAEVDALYALPLGEFTAARDELARRLRREGHRDAGADVKRLRKPTVAAWALNQVRRKGPAESDELIEAGTRLREGQERLLAGAGREPLQRAAADERRLVDELGGQAERELAAGGHPVSAAVQEKLRATLHAAASDPEARERLAAGRLVRDHEATGLGPLAEGAAAPPGAGPRKRERKPPAALQRKARQLEERLERARTRQRELGEESAEAGRHLSEVRREAARAAAAAEQAEAAAGRKSKRAAEAAEGVRKLEAELDQLGRDSTME